MINIILDTPLSPTWGWIFVKTDSAFKVAYGGGKMFKVEHSKVQKQSLLNQRIPKLYDNKHPFNIITEEIYD